MNVCLFPYGNASAGEFDSFEKYLTRLADASAKRQTLEDFMVKRYKYFN